MSKFNSKTSFLYQFFKGNSNFIVLKPCTVIYLTIFYDFHCYLYLFICLFMHLYTFIWTLHLPGNSHKFLCFDLHSRKFSRAENSPSCGFSGQKSLQKRLSKQASFLAGGVPATNLSPCMECLNVSNTETKYTHAYLLDLLCIQSTE